MADVWVWVEQVKRRTVQYLSRQSQCARDMQTVPQQRGHQETTPHGWVETQNEMAMTGTTKTTDPITQNELRTLFGESIPIEAIKLIFDAPDERTIGELRRQLREMARDREI